jgi:transposase InsO family protein
VLVTNFAKEELVIPKSTAVGVAEEISEALVATINADETPRIGTDSRAPRRVEMDPEFREYVGEKLAHLTEEERKVMEPVLLRYRGVFHDEERNDFRGVDVAEHRIVTGDTRPIRRPQYRTPYALRQELDNQVQEMLKKGVIEPSDSPWNAPVVLIPKRSSTGQASYRFCVDYRALNAVTRPDAYPLPLLEDSVQALHGCRYYSVLDAYSGYWQVRLAEEDKAKTAFSTPSGHFAFCRLPFGVGNGPASFQRLVDVLLRELSGVEAFAYLDDVIVFSRTIEEHAERLGHVLDRFERANLLLQPSKCKFAQAEVKYLGYVVSREGLKACPEKTEAIRRYPAPKNVKEIRAFLGLSGFYRKLVRDFASIAKPLTELTKKDVPFNWGQDQQKAFEQLKDALCSDSVLAYPDFTQEFILSTDASAKALGAILSQVQDGVERPISFGSRQLGPAEKNYSATELELAALVWASRHYRHYLLGRKFLVRSDHAALRYLHRFSDNNSRLLKWSLRLAEFDFRVDYIPGKQLPHVDSLSRSFQTATQNAELSKEVFRREQGRDPFCKTLRVKPAGARSEYFYDQDGVIYKRRSGAEPLLVVPKSLEQEVVALNHEPIFAAHPGIKRTIDILKLRYWWPGMTQAADKFVRECDSCQRRKGENEYKAPLGVVRQPSQPFEICHLDFVGPFALSDQKNKYILTFIDQLTKYVEAVAVPDTTAATAARAFVTQIVARHGVCQTLVTDRGTSFTALFFKEVCRILGVKQLMTSSFHPAGNAQIERFHRTMHKSLSHYINASGTNWDTILNLFVLSYNGTPHSSSGYSPFYLIYGREVVLPTSQQLRAKLDPDLKDTDAVSRLENLQKSLQRAYKIVGTNLRKSYDKNKKYYDRNASVRDFDEGDVVYLHNPRGNPKLSRKFRMIWTGPFRVQRRTGQLNYAIESPDGKEQVVHINRLKQANDPGIWERKRRAPRTKRVPPPRSDTEEEDAESQVERPLRRGAPLVDNRQPIPRTPDRARPHEPETPATEDGGRNDARDLHGDPDFVPSASPRSRLQLQTTRDLPPQTRARARLQALRDESQ